MVIFLGELNNLNLWTIDIGNAYLETSEKVYIITGSEFKELKIHIIVISKVLYRLLPIQSRPKYLDASVRRHIYGYVALCIDDFAIAMKNPKEFIAILEVIHEFKNKETGRIRFHYGMEFVQDDDGTLCITPAKYIKNLVTIAT